MNEQTKYRDMVNSGASVTEVYLASKADGLSWIETIRQIRELFDLSIVNAKEVSIVADELATSLSEYQERFVSALETGIEEEQKDAQRSQE